jgi:glycosyltransferase
LSVALKQNAIDSLYGDLVYVDEENTRSHLPLLERCRLQRNAFNGADACTPYFLRSPRVVQQLGGYERILFAADFEFMTRYLYKHRISSFYMPELIVRCVKAA